MGKCLAVVVDDNRRSLRAIEVLLGRRGFEPVSFGSFHEARAALESPQLRPTALVIDLILDGGNLGTDLADHARCHVGPHVPIAIVSGYSTEVDLRSPSIDTFLEKPLSGESFSEFLIEAILRTVVLAPNIHAAIAGFSTQYGLVPQETRIVAQLSSGSTRSKLVGDLGMSANTIKWQIRQLLSKTGCRDMSEVFSRLLTNINERHRQQVERGKGTLDELGRRSKLPD